MTNSKDQSNLYQKILEFPSQFREGIESAQNFSPNFKNPFSNIIIAGMGGSSLPGQMLKSINQHEKITDLPIIIHQNYGLPKEANPSSLLVFISYSGDTEETLSSFNEALGKQSKIITIGTGGTLAKLSKENNFSHILMPNGLPPRIAIGEMFSTLVSALVDVGAIKDIRNDLLMLEKSLDSKKMEEKSQNFIEKLAGKIPLIYSSEKWEVLGKIWKINFNETTEIPSFFSVLPDLNHHEMAGFTDHGPESNHKDFHLLFLLDSQEDQNILKRIRMTGDLLSENEIYSDAILLEGKNVFEKMFSNIVLSYWVSYHLALKYGIDPFTAKLTKEFKNRLNLYPS